MPGTDLDLITQAARDAGDIATGYFQRDPKTWEKSDDAGPVTEADLAVDAMLKARFLTERPNYGWLSEETEDDPARLGTDTVFIVDPIDGTRAFIQGNENWAHSIAIARHGVITDAAVYLPMKDMMFTSTRGLGAHLNGSDIATSKARLEDVPSVLAQKANYDPRNWPDGVPELDRCFRSSLAYRLCLVAQGRFDAMLTLRGTWEWDIAAGALIAEEAGARVYDRTGGGLRFNTSAAKLNGVVAANPDLAEDLLARLR